MLAAWCRPEGWVFDNDLVAEYTRAFPDRFVRDDSGRLLRADIRPVNLFGEVERQGRLAGSGGADDRDGPHCAVQVPTK